MKEAYITKFRQALNLDSDQFVLHVADIISSPNREQFFTTGNDSSKPHLHASRALPIANIEDIVILSGTLEQQYYSWLRSLNLSTESVYSYDLSDTKSSLAEIIAENPEPVQRLLGSRKDKAVYLPFYASQKDMQVANEVLGVSFFGANEDITRRYFDKLTFKNICQELGIKTIEGETHDLGSGCNVNRSQLVGTVSRLLHSYDKLIIRGSIGSAGRSLYTADNPDQINQIYKQLITNKDEQILIEPFLNVISSPNDQWVIDMQGNIKHLSLSAQLFQGLKHVGNIFGQYYSKRIQREIEEISGLIVKHMAEVGYVGVIGIDYIVTNEGVYPIENNARVNGSTYVHALAEQLEKQGAKINCWKFFKAQTQSCSFDELKSELSDLIYGHAKDNFVFPFDCDSLSQNGAMTMIIFAEDFYHIDYIQDILSQKNIIRR